jgi:hypothetical protein
MAVKDPHHGDIARLGFAIDDVLLDVDLAAAREQIIAGLAQPRMSAEECP